VQVKVTTAWGWMLGAIPKTANFQDMKEFYENRPLLKDFQIEARQQSIRLFPGRQKIPDKLDVKAIYIYGDDTKTAAGRKAFNRVFGSRREGGLPEERVVKFIPNSADNRFPITPAKMKDMIKMVAKQNRNIERSRDIITTALIDTAALSLLWTRIQNMFEYFSIRLKRRNLHYIGHRFSDNFVVYMLRSHIQKVNG
jgi:hypothetical protein